MSGITAVPTYQRFCALIIIMWAESVEADVPCDKAAVTQCSYGPNNVIVCQSADSSATPAEGHLLWKWAYFRPCNYGVTISQVLRHHTRTSHAHTKWGTRVLSHRYIATRMGQFFFFSSQHSNGICIPSIPNFTTKIGNRLFLFTWGQKPCSISVGKSDTGL